MTVMSLVLGRGYRLLTYLESEDTNSCSRRGKPWENSLVADMVFKGSEELQARYLSNGLK